MSKINLAPVNIAYTLNSKMYKRHVAEIPSMDCGPKLLYQNQHTYKLKKKYKPNNELCNIQGLASMPKFNPQDLGIPE